MTALLSRLNAQFNRAHISERDFQEAAEYLKAFRRCRSATIKRALLLSAIVAYCRPFTSNERGPQSSATPQLPINPTKELSEQELQLHGEILDLRNQALAHSESSRRPTTRVMGTGTGFLVQAKPFDVLSERIDLKLFEGVCEKLALYCGRKLFELNHKIRAAE